jgi:hypothetical protein
MAESPWRCSACGTINEPVANSCRTCGKWPSLFDLQDNIVEEVELEDARELAPAAPLPSEPVPDEPEPVEPELFEPEPFEPELSEPDLSSEQPSPRRRMFDPPPTDPVLGEGEGGHRGRWVSWLLPLAFVVYIVISIVFGDR